MKMPKIPPRNLLKKTRKKALKSRKKAPRNLSTILKKALNPSPNPNIVPPIWCG